ncbi:hypothetical protein K8T06_07200 [bacterium]|nr:hypothetical protein [bacterium]
MKKATVKITILFNCVIFSGLFFGSSVNAELDWVRISTEYIPERIDGHQMVYDIKNEIILMFGWFYDDRMYSYNGYDWQPIFPAGQDWPGPRSHFGMAYDSDREVVVIFGGFRGGFDYLGDTWEWDGTQWEEKFPVHSPLDRTGLKMTYADFLGKAMLFGGYTENSEVTNELWSWDGVDWVLESTSGPSPRTSLAISCDSFRNKIVLFGGTDNGSNPLDDTWEWDGILWQDITTSTVPLGAYLHSLTFDSSRGVSILFGGVVNSDGLSDKTWEYDGEDWIQVFSQHHPSERGQSAICYDSTRERVVLFGGYAWSAQNDTWEYYDVPPTPTPTPTPTSTPTASPTPSPTPTNTSPCMISGVVLTMPSHLYYPGDSCWLNATICLDPKPSEPLPFFLILEVYGTYFYYPPWTDIPDYQSIDVPVSGETLKIFPSFDWPDNAGSGDAIFYGAFTNNEMTTLTGEIGVWEFEWEN